MLKALGAWRFPLGTAGSRLELGLEDVAILAEGQIKTPGATVA